MKSLTLGGVLRESEKHEKIAGVYRPFYLGSLEPKKGVW
jgi:hypothetical protein